ncbi:MAG: hypothetical protein MJZ66_04055 [Bacteroidales bacterium]|nr:hypothetical protein [Bacteroidales bacterium]
MMKLNKQYLIYFFSYDQCCFIGRIILDECFPGIEMWYWDHEKEISWEKHFAWRDKIISINITLMDDWNDMDTLGMVTASPWICVYKGDNLVAQFEPEQWAYIDEANNRCNIHKDIF